MNDSSTADTSTADSAALAQLHPAERAALQQLAAGVGRVLVTGAGGFLGKAICRRLLAAGIRVTGFARGHYPELSAMGVDMVRGDIADGAGVQAALQAFGRCELVFHVASKAGVWGSRASYFSPNVDGAANVVAACRALNIPALVYTSTPSVTFAGKDEAGIDESAPYAARFLNHYAESKALAERLMLGANGSSCADGTRLKTVALRPHLIWGPGDPHLVPRVLARGRSGRLKLVGREDKLVDTIYVDNAAHGHILAALDLCAGAPQSAGKAYFLSNDEPITMAAMLNRILACDGLAPVSQRVPTALAYGVGALLEGAYRLLGKQQEPIMTRFVARQLSTSHYFDITAAKRDLGYRPLVSLDEGMVRLKASL
ncbi:2-alkyl-3-oxoalkanoate reductase [Shewanella salipaludis]|uniref:NAD-dependent epimerase/dehydratase family protein n=1 Tax=Shewanella salipaludis TaxID=2723052 RepID=A0A972FWD1_9GAMM|nr:2-alkyl-3-oxoalkanoate reductase [Shewanella salipaludis]NMH64483.1 NAD-dependent epimerase/dehydratase family protein [Shewanella salipaludis]